MDLSGPFYGHGSRPCKLPEAGRSSAARTSEVGVRRSLDTYAELLHAPKKSTDEYRLDRCAWNFKRGGGNRTDENKTRIAAGACRSLVGNIKVD